MKIQREREKEGKEGRDAEVIRISLCKTLVSNTENSKPGYSGEGSIAFARFCQGHKAQMY